MFFGQEVKQNQNKASAMVMDSDIHLSQAVLDPASKGNKKDAVCLMAEIEGKSFILAVLDPSQSWQCPLDLVLAAGTEVKFFLRGQGSVHLTGYEFQEDDDYEMSLSSSDEEIEEIEEMEEEPEEKESKHATKKIKTKSSPNKAKNSPAKTNGLKSASNGQAKTSGDVSSDDDDDSDDEDLSFGSEDDMSDSDESDKKILTSHDLPELSSSDDEDDEDDENGNDDEEEDYDDDDDSDY